jgi:hypothetical protein
MSIPPRRPGEGPPRDIPPNASDPLGKAAIVPSDPPIAPAITDAEAGGASPDATQRAAAPPTGPRVQNQVPGNPPAGPKSMIGMWGWIAAVVVLLLVLFVLVGRS